MELSNSDISCGVKQLFSLVVPSRDEIDIELFYALYHFWGGKLTSTFPPCGMVIFSDVTTSGNGTRLAKFIKKEELGDVYASPIVNNPNTKHDITLWTWVVDRPALRTWAMRMKKSGKV